MTIACEPAVQSVALLMPMYNEAQDIDDTLASIAAQSYAHEAMYLIVVDGGSTDDSRERVEAWFAAGDIRGEVVTNLMRSIPTSLNAGLRRAKPEDIIVRLDAHTTYEPGYVSAIVAALDGLPPSVACVGGAQTPRQESRFDQALVVALYQNPMGLGGAPFRHSSEPRPVASVYLGAWRPGELQAAGGYDADWKANEDAELAARLRARGRESYFIPIASEYRVKRGPLEAVRQWGRYGFWRARTLRRHPREVRARHLVPPVVLASCMVLLATPFRGVVAALFVAYAAAVFARRRRGEAFAVTLASCVFFPACQVAWTCGLFVGLARPRRGLAAPIVAAENA